jgi:hypothetical protein
VSRHWEISDEEGHTEAGGLYKLILVGPIA